ncbi:unnamed protein product [Symbiodinium natans]|uniref:Uncharacterized protein n=1 Tax=Symbiodinium natans TaxID=878477 RepID=A0A812I229_9DINO|nr:unnamed protein product [Symbiodinium natans]
MVEEAVDSSSFACRLERLEALMASLPKQLEALHNRIDALVLSGSPGTLGTPSRRPSQVRVEDGEGPVNPEVTSIAMTAPVLASTTTQFTALHEQLTKIRQESEKEEEEGEEDTDAKAGPKQTRFMLLPGSTSLTIVGKRLIRMGSRLSQGSAPNNYSYSPAPFSLPPSCWGCLPLLGLQEEFGWVASTLTFLGLTLTSLLQLLFAWILSQGFLENSYTGQDLRDWRLLAHSAAFYDPVSGTSLANRICRNGSLDLLGVLNEVRGFLLPAFLLPAVSDISVGVLLSSMAILIWASYVTVEVAAALRLVRALHLLPCNETAVEQVDAYRSFKSISDERRIGVSLLLFCRCAVLLTLGFTGGVWLSRLHDAEDILRDCVTLVMVLELDDLAYKLLTAHNRKAYLGSITTFVIQEGHQTLGCSLAMVVRLLGLFLTVIFFISFRCVHSAELGQEINSVLCGGNVDFVFSTHPSLGAPIVLDTHSLESGAQQTHAWAFSYERQADQAMFNITLQQGQVAVKRAASVEELQAYLALTDRQASDGFVTGCEDLGRESLEGAWLWPAMEAAGASNCQQAKPFCDRRDMPLARLLCPTTCGCFDAASGLFAGNGCRQRCYQEADLFNRTLSTAPCEDLESQGDDRSPAWSRWWQGFRQAYSNMTSIDPSTLTFAAGPCSFLTMQEDHIRDYFCHGGNDRPGTALCPVTCGCASGTISKWCPSTC